MSDLPEGFEDLDYPGKRKPVNRGPKTKNDPDEDNPFGKPLRYFFNGSNVEFYTIKTLANVLGYSVQSIRAWEDKRLMPKSPFRSPRTKGAVAGGRSNKGRRLWTEQQIRDVLRIAEAHGVILNREPPTPAFARDVNAAFEAERERIEGKQPV